MIQSGRIRIIKSLNKLSIADWNEINDTGDLSYLLTGEVSKETLIKIWGKLTAAWDGLNNEFIKKFGLSEEYREFLNLKLDWLHKYAEYLQDITNMEILQELELLEQDLEDYREKFKGGMSFGDIYGWVRKASQTHISLSNTSVYEFYSILNREVKMAQPNNG